METVKGMQACTCEGTVKSFDTAKGHGFITQADLSVNRDVIQGQGDSIRNLAVGDRVRYEVTQGATSPQAANVRKI
jgi:cold shock CspA family protein